MKATSRLLDGQVAVITGAGSGIGRGIAIALGKAGVRVVVSDIREADAIDVASSIGDQATALRCDVTSSADFESLKERALETFGRIDIVVNNAGVLTGGRPESLPLEEWQRIIDCNLLSVVRSNTVFLPLLLAQGTGHVVNTSSFSGIYTYSSDRLPYAASKAALVQLSEGLALYLRPKGIGVTCLCPGPVRTNITRSLPKFFGDPLPMQGPGAQFRLLEPEEVGEQVVEAIRRDTFMLYTHPEVRDLLVERARDWDTFLQARIDHPHIVVPPK